MELVDPTKPLRRGRPKGSRNAPKSASTESEKNTFFFGSTRVHDGLTPTFPRFIAKSLDDGASPILRMKYDHVDTPLAGVGGSTRKMSSLEWATRKGNFFAYKVSVKSPA